MATRNLQAPTNTGFHVPEPVQVPVTSDLDAIQNFRMIVDHDFKAMNTLITEKIQSEVALINAISHHIIGSGGKRLRPLLVLLASRACRYEGEHHIALAAMVEFLHTATLLHDDVIDDSKLRRGKHTANEIWGSKASIIVGDYLFAQHMDLIVGVGNLDVMRLMTEVSRQISRGEAKQMMNRHNPLLSEEDYFETIYSKTSLLFAASAKIGALISNESVELEQSIYQYGLHLGNAFQLIDDALDYCADVETLGKNIGDDLADGKATLPIIYALKHGTPKQQERIETSLTQGKLEHLSDIQEAIESTKAIDYTRSLAAAEVEQGLSALQAVPDSAYKDGLVNLAYYALQRNH